MNYEPFGPEWEKEILKNSKAEIMKMFRELCRDYAESEAKIACLNSVKDAAVRYRAMFEALSDGIPWGKTFLSADNIREMNEAPGQLARALKEFEARFKDGRK